MENVFFTNITIRGPYRILLISKFCQIFERLHGVFIHGEFVVLIELKQAAGVFELRNDFPEDFHFVEAP